MITHLRVLGESYLTECMCLILVLWTKVASALERLSMKDAGPLRGFSMQACAYLIYARFRESCGHPSIMATH